MSGSQYLTRRSLFGLAAGGVLTGRMPVTVDPALAIGRATDRDNPDFAMRRSGPSMEVAGLRDSALGAWARQLQAPLAAGLAQDGRLVVRYGGGVDGVTAANQFDARTVPDGQAALLFCGSVALAWLAGDGERVQLDPSHLLPMLAAYGPAVLMARGPLPAPQPGSAPGGGDPARRVGRVRFGAAAPLRLAIGPVPDAGLTALLGLDLLGIPAWPVPVRTDAIAAARAGAADAVFVHGPDARSRAASLLEAGFQPVLSSEAGGEAALAAGAAGTMPGGAAPPFLAGLTASRLNADPLVVAWRAMASACALCAVLAVPRLTPARAIGRWRRAVALGAADEGVGARAESQALRLATGPDVAWALSATEISFPVQLALRRWIAGRDGWRRS